jgi:hypothetical protein
MIDDDDSPLVLLPTYTVRVPLVRYADQNKPDKMYEHMAVTLPLTSIQLLEISTK